MKKIIFALALSSAALLSSSFTYAADTNPDANVKQAFVREFSQIKDVQWTHLGTEGIFEAKFKFNNDDVQAFFTNEGEFLGTTRQIVKSQLPIMIVTALDKQYADARVATIFEYCKTDGLSYYVTIVTSKGAMVIKALSTGELSVYKKNVQ